MNAGFWSGNLTSNHRVHKMTVTKVDGKYAFSVFSGQLKKVPSNFQDKYIYK